MQLCGTEGPSSRREKAEITVLLQNLGGFFMGTFQCREDFLVFYQGQSIQAELENTDELIILEMAEDETDAKWCLAALIAFQRTGERPQCDSFAGNTSHF